MAATRPYGDLETATILVLGHDPRLQKSPAEAEKAFFFDYLEKYAERPTYGPHASKYDLAKGVWDYVSHLAGRKVALEELFVTNLCNEFLPHTPGSGTVLIPLEYAQRGLKEITQLIAKGKFKLILPMAVQPFYYLCNLGFIDEGNELVQSFIAGAKPSPKKAKAGIYQQTGYAPFLKVCGQCFHHAGIPVVPVVHVKMWPLKPRFKKYTQPMQMACRHVSQLLN